MADFLLLVQGDDSSTATPEDMQKRMEDYRGWMMNKMQAGQVKGGQPLEPRGSKVTKDKSVVTDGPFLEPKEIIAGYIIVHAKDLEEATEIAQGCPLLDHCELMVRPLIDVPMD